MNRKFTISSFLLIFIFLQSISSYSKILTAGPGKEYSNISSALDSASAGDTIEVHGVISADGMIGNGIVIYKSISIIGVDYNSSIIEANSSFQNSDRRVISVLSEINVTIKNICLRNGKAIGNGGAIENLGNLVLFGCLIENNSGKYGGGIRNGLGAMLIMHQCIVRNNECSKRGGGINHIGSLLSINDIIIEKNTAVEEGGGVQIENANASILNATISGNLLKSINKSNGAGIFIGNYKGNQTYNITNTTISGNTHTTNGFDSFCGGGIGIINIGGQINMLLTNCTIADNNAYCGKGLQIYSYENNAVIDVKMVNTIISNGLSGNYFEFTSNGGKINIQRTYSILSDLSIPIGGGGNVNGIDPELDALAYNGGFGFTHALKSTSPAIDAGTSINTPAFDQRGALRSGKTDIGAFEYNGIFDVLKENDDLQIKIFPNPCQSFLNVSLYNLQSQASFSLFDLSGKLILQGKLTDHQNQLVIDKISDGFYVLKIMTEDGQLLKTEKIIIKK